MLKKLGTIEADNSHAMWPEMKIHRNIDRFQERGDGEGLRQMEAVERNKVYPPELNSFKRASLPRFDAVSQSQEHETPVIMLMFIFTVSINHINWIIAECRGYGPRIIWSMKSAAPIIQLIKSHKCRENSSINLSLWIPHLGFNLHHIQQCFSNASSYPQGAVC